MQQDIEAIKQTFLKMDERARQAEQDLKKLHDFSKTLANVEANIQVLQNFYLSEAWLKNREAVYKDNENTSFYTAGEDPIWNIIQDFNLAKIELLKQLANSL